MYITDEKEPNPHEEALRQIGNWTPTPLEVLVLAEEYTSRERHIVKRPEPGEREGKQIVAHNKDRESSRTHTILPPLKDRKAHPEHIARTRSTQISPKPRLSELTVKCCRTRLLHLAPHGSGSAGVQKASTRVGRASIGTCLSTEGYRWMSGGSVTSHHVRPPRTKWLLDRFRSLPGSGLPGRPCPNPFPDQHRLVWPSQALNC